MRMWMVDPKILCLNHLLAEHSETHMFIGSIKKKIKMNGYHQNDLLEPMSLLTRHEELVNEFKRRNLNHKSDLIFDNDVFSYLSEQIKNHVIDSKNSLHILLSKCDKCKKRYDELNQGILK